MNDTTPRERFYMAYLSLLTAAAGRAPVKVLEKLSDASAVLWYAIDGGYDVTVSERRAPRAGYVVEATIKIKRKARA